MMIIARIITVWDYIPQCLAWGGFLVFACLLICMAFSSYRISFVRKWKTLFAVSLIMGCFGLFLHIQREERIDDLNRRMSASREMGRIESAAFVFFSNEGNWPQGDNATVIATLLEHDIRNPILSTEEIHVSAIGAAVDPWGTPYSMSVSEEEGFRMRSAGPDRILGTTDDHRR
jgi:hypothetical protein